MPHDDQEMEVPNLLGFVWSNTKTAVFVLEQNCPLELFATLRSTFLTLAIHFLMDLPFRPKDTLYPGFSVVKILELMAF